MVEWVAEHQSALTLIVTIVLGFLVLGIWASRKPERPPAASSAGTPVECERDFHRDVMKCLEGDNLLIEDVLDREDAARRRPPLPPELRGRKDR